jgi:hypothetical protein
MVYDTSKNPSFYHLNPFPSPQREEKGLSFRGALVKKCKDTQYPDTSGKVYYFTR